jgi:asparagine synthase (glutamine-hydrolysing)
MCGIVASWRPHGHVSEEALAAGTRALRHRGPDGQGTWIAADRTIALGHTRLAITAPGNGAQPVTSEDGRIVAVVNGEIYGHRALRRELAAAGHAFRTESDSELLVHLYEDRGLGFLDAIDGELCFALWDGHAQRLVAGRDRFGARTLVWRRAGGGIDLASEAKALFAMGAPARWDRAAMGWAMAMQYVPADRTVFEGISMLPPGSVLVADAGGVRVQRWAAPPWQPQAATAWPGSEPGSEPGNEPRNESVAIEAFRRTFLDAVADRVDTGARFCFHLSGGIDSAAVLGAAAAVTGQTLDAFTVSFPGSPLDELAHAAANAGHVGARLHPIALAPRDLLAALESAAAAGEGLAVNGHLGSHFLMDRAIQAAGFRVILSGEGADELLAGYPHLREDLAALAGTALPASDSSATRGLMLAHGDTLPLDAVRERLGFVPAFVRAKASIGAKLRALTSESFLQGAAADLLAQLASEDEARALRALHPVDASLTLWTRLALGGYILPTLSDRLQGAHGLEGRLPFLDGRLIGLMRGLPLAARIRDDQEKWILRQAARGLVPEAARLRRKHPFLAPATVMDRDPGVQELVRHMLGDFRARTFFDPDAIARRMRALEGADPAEQAAWEPAFLLALTAHALGRAYALEP